jgi:hypothetical protein
LEPVVAYILILLTVALINLLPALLASPVRRSPRTMDTDLSDDPLEPPVAAQPAFAEVD